MNNYERYRKMDKQLYNRKNNLSYFFMRKKIDEIIIPYLERISGNEILEVGLGYGYYTEMYMYRNKVTGYDINPDMADGLGIEMIAGRAGDITKVNQKYDRVMSFCMTEYLDSKELEAFIVGE